MLWLIAGVVFGAYATISVFRYLRRDPTSWDLGIFTEYVKQFAHLHAPIVDIRGPGFNLLGDHFHPIVAVLAPFFRLAPTPVTLLIAQALLTALSVIPVYRAADQLLSRGAAQAITAAYGLSWGLQQLANYDFHEIAFAVPLLAASLSALIRGRTRAAIWWALPLVLVKEDQGFTLAALGLIIAFSYRRHAPGLILAGWGLAWSLLAILVIIPHFSGDHTYSYWSQAGAISPVGGNFSVGGLWSHLTDGIGTKLPTLALILLPTAFLALRSPLVLAILPSLALRFIALKSAYWGTDWHYNATVMPIVFIAAIDGMARIKAARARAEDGSQDTAGAGSNERPAGCLRPARGRQPGALRRGRDAGAGGRARLPVPAQLALDAGDLLARTARGGRERRDGAGPERREGLDRPRSAGTAGRQDRYLLARQLRQPGDHLRGLRHREHRLAAAAGERAAVCGAAGTRGAVPADLRAGRGLCLPPRRVTAGRRPARPGSAPVTSAVLPADADAAAPATPRCGPGCPRPCAPAIWPPRWH